MFNYTLFHRPALCTTLFRGGKRSAYFCFFITLHKGLHSYSACQPLSPSFPPSFPPSLPLPLSPALPPRLSVSPSLSLPPSPSLSPSSHTHNSCLISHRTWYTWYKQTHPQMQTHTHTSLRSPATSPSNSLPCKMILRRMLVCARALVLAPSHYGLVPISFS